MRNLLPALILLAATTAANATTFDDFVLTGNGHTYAFSLPATGLVSGEPENGITGRVRYLKNTSFATVDGVPSGGASGLFVLEPGDYGTVAFDIGSAASGISDIFHGPVLVGYNPVSLSGYISGPYQAFFLTGTFDLFTRQGYVDRTLYTLTITPEASTTPEPATLALLGTGALGFLTRLRRPRRPCMTA